MITLRNIALLLLVAAVFTLFTYSLRGITLFRQSGPLAHFNLLLADDKGGDIKNPPEDKSGDEKKEVAKEFYNLGSEALKNKDYHKAILMLNRAINYNEVYAEAYAKLGEAQELLKEDEELAFENYKKCIELINTNESPTDDLVKLKADITRKIEKYKALEDKLSGYNDEFIASLMNLGEKCTGEDNWILAEEIYSLILKVEMDNDEAAELLRKTKDKIANE